MPKDQPYCSLPLVFMGSTVLNQVYISVPGAACAIPLPRLLQELGSCQCFSSPGSPLVSQRERQILSQMIPMQVSGENLLTIHIPKWFCTLTYGSSLWWLYYEGRNTVLRAAGRGQRGAQGVTAHRLAVTGMVGSRSPGNGGASGRTLGCHPAAR